ncbi:MAG: hypothetical protein D3908_15520 [Candidatus Electrothrix sp. AUS4]|nr:hypothetical protein [Candidatus Electrothrix sp. AUS4]
MGDITIRIPQKIHIEYTLKSASLAKRILDLINTLICRDDVKDDSMHLLNSSPKHPRLGDLALQCFGPDEGVDLELREHTKHQPMELDQ